VASLNEYFFKELESFGVHQELTISSSTGVTKAVTEKVHFDLQAGVNFISYFFPEGIFDVALAQYLLSDPGQAITRVKEAVSTFTAHPTGDPEGVVPEDQPLSGRVWFYVDDYLDAAVRAVVIDQAASTGVSLKIRDRAHADYLTEHESPLAFISHDSRDKEDVARPLAERLSSMLWPVWYDEYSLRVGQSLRESID